MTRPRMQARILELLYSRWFYGEDIVDVAPDLQDEPFVSGAAIDAAFLELQRAGLIDRRAGTEAELLPRGVLEVERERLGDATEMQAAMGERLQMLRLFLRKYDGPSRTKYFYQSDVRELGFTNKRIQYHFKYMEAVGWLRPKSGAHVFDESSVDDIRRLVS